jgi:hypothetical protein
MRSGFRRPLQGLLLCLTLVSTGLAAQPLPATEAVNMQKATLEETRAKRIQDGWLEGIKIAIGAFGGAWAVWQFIASQRHAFKLKAIELALDADSPDAAKNRATFIQKTFSGVLPEQFVSEFGSNELGFGASKRSRKDFLALVAQYPAQRKQIIEDWKAVFPYDFDGTTKGGGKAWLSRIR